MKEHYHFRKYFRRTKTVWIFSFLLSRNMTWGPRFFCGSYSYASECKNIALWFRISLFFSFQHVLYFCFYSIRFGSREKYFFPLALPIFCGYFHSKIPCHHELRHESRKSVIFFLFFPFSFVNLMYNVITVYSLRLFFFHLPSLFSFSARHRATDCWWQYV